MTQLAQPVEPFGEVNVHRRPDGRLDVVATILMEPDIEGSQTGLALDGSASMKKLYGAQQGLSPIFAKAGNAATNVVEPVARSMAAYLAKFSANGQVCCLYWACGTGGAAVEDLGSFDEHSAAALSVRGPRHWGTGTRLLPPLRHLVEQRFAAAPWAIAVFITDGVIDDLEEVKAYSRRFAADIAAGRRRFAKMVLIGLGESVNEAQMTELDDMFEGSGLTDPAGRAIDIWDHKIAQNMKQLAEVFAEVVSEDTLVAEHGTVCDDLGRVVQRWSDGLPALLRFTLPVGSRAFRLSLPGGDVTQDISSALSGR